MTKKKENRRKKIKKKLLHKYRLVVLNEDTFEERVSFKLTRLNVFVAGTLFAVLLIASTTLLIAFTPIREYIPGYSSTQLKLQAINNADKADSLQMELARNNEYLNSIRKVLTGDLKVDQINKDSLFESYAIDAAEFDLSPSRQDSILRAEVAQEDKYNLFESATSGSGFILFPPATGNISEGYNVKDKHYAVDIVLEKDTPIKAVADGTVIFSEWTAQTGYVIILEHVQGLISVYKHNGSLTKQQGDLVKAGEVIATSGDTGELTTGPHLHFELWNDGYPMNPTNFIDFE